MGILHTNLMATVRKLSVQPIRRLVADKLAAEGYPHDDDLVGRITHHLVNTPNLPLEFQGDDLNIQLVFTEEDAAKLNQYASEFTSTMVEVAKSTAKTLARGMLRDYERSWNDYQEYEQFQISVFKENLAVRWGASLDGLRLLLDMSREFGEINFKNLRRSKSAKNRNLKTAVARLHLRSCQVAFEIITLLENGLADGAMARWRTLYEICVVATLIDDGGDELAEACHVAASWASDCYRHCSGEAIQLHGGIGFTWEHPAHLYFKRARASSTWLGTPEQHREALARIIIKDAA